MSSRRRLWLASAAPGALSPLILWCVLAGSPGGTNAADPPPPPPPLTPPPGVGGTDGQRGGNADPDKTEFSDAITLPRDSNARGQIERAEDLINEEEWGKAVDRLQRLLDQAEDRFVQISRRGPGGRSRPRWTSVRSEANRLLAGLPPDGLQFYELTFGPRARARLTEAREANDPQGLADVAQRYLYTAAGAEATALLGTYYLDRGQPFMAARCFERLMTRSDPVKMAPVTLFKAALAFHRSGEHAQSERFWRLLTERAGRDGVQAGGRTLALADLRAALDRAVPSPVNPYNWAMFRGDPRRANVGNGDTPFLEATWRWSMIPEHITGGASPGLDAETVTSITEKLALAANKVRETKPPLMCSFFPIAAGDKLVYRDYAGIQAWNLKTGAHQWTAVLDGSLGQMHTGDLKGTFEKWLTENYFSTGPSNVLFENSTVGMLSSDNTLVFAVDDLAVPPHTNALQNNQNGQSVPDQPSLGNRLHAFNLQTGKAVWDHPNSRPKTEDPEFANTFFLGAPLPLGGKLYVMTEKNAELRLLCLDAASGALTWAQTLASARDRLPLDLSRRLSSVHLSYGEGMLICPTNAGAVLGVDLLTHSLVWAHSYREPGQDGANQEMIAPGIRPGRVIFRPGMMPQAVHDGPNSEWKVSAPVVRNGRVVFTAPDAQSVHCLNLRDGRLLWSAPRGEGVFMAGVYGTKVLLVGRTACVALNLEDGKQAWKSFTGTPSGQGVAAGAVYYLPLQAAAHTKQAAVCALDLETGNILANTESRHKDVPGNLIFHDGMAVSQSYREVVVYPQLSVKRRQVELLLAKNPADPVGLTERAELLLDKGEAEAALTDLRAARSHDPPAAIKGKLADKMFEALTHLMQHKFGVAERYLDEYEKMCLVEVRPTATDAERRAAEKEQQRRRANYLCLLGKGREVQGRPVEAFKAYAEFGGLSGNTTLLTVIDEDPTFKVRPDVWAQGRIAGLLARATPDQRRPIEDLINQQWVGLKAREFGPAAGGADELEPLKRFAGLFGRDFAAGREARLELAERLMVRNAQDDFLTAELQLQALRRQTEDRVMAARALEALARLRTRWGLLPDAARCYTELARDYPDVVIPGRGGSGGKTGAELFNELSTDKRFLPHLEEARSLWFDGSVKARPAPIKEASNFPLSYSLDAVGEAPPFFDRCRVGLGVSSHHVRLRLIDRLTGEDRGGPDLLHSDQANRYLNLSVRTAYHTQGHLVLFGLGHLVFAVDPLTQRKLWEYNLFGAGLPPPHAGGSGGEPTVGQDTDGSLILQYSNGTKRRIGQMGPTGTGYVSVLTRDGLTCLDPLTGQVLWTKSDLSPRGHLFGDDDYLFLVDYDDHGTATGGRAFRTRDGGAVKVPPFLDLFDVPRDDQPRPRLLGRTALVAETDKNLVLRQRDLLTGNDLWSKTYPAGSRLMDVQDPHLLGVMLADGRFDVTDLRSRQVVLRGELRDPSHLDRGAAVHLLADREQYYLIMNGSAAGEANQPGQGTGPWPNVAPSLRSLPVSGYVYAFDRKTGAFRWHTAEPVANQMIILEQFQDLPLLLFTAKYARAPREGGSQPPPVTGVVSVEKRTGVLRLKWESTTDIPQFFGIQTNPREGSIDLVSTTMRVRHTVVLPNVRPAAGGGTDTPGGPPAAANADQTTKAPARPAVAGDGTKKRAVPAKAGAEEHR